MNCDGTVDAVLVGATATGAEVRTGDGQGGFTLAGNAPLGQAHDEVALADVDGDGNLDAVVRPITGSTLQLILGDGLGSFQPGPHPQIRVLLNDGAGSFPSNLPNIPTATVARTIGAADFNGDGHTDLSVYGGFDTIAVHTGDGAGTFAAPVKHAVWSRSRRQPTFRASTRCSSECCCTSTR